jgi:nucleoside-diphosphate-sugar epimerase/rhodanese-related sulfurtransferase
MTVRWITPLLCTGPGAEVTSVPDAVVIDVRSFVDRAGNTPAEMREKLLAGAKALNEGKPTFVCCDHGISRSNAFAAGILTLAENIPFEESLRKVIEATGENEIRADVVADMQRALANHPPGQTSSSGKQKWLLIGGSGALGSLILRSAPDDIEILAPTREEVDLQGGSVSLSLYARSHGITRFLHFASPRIGNTNRAMGEALTMLRTVLETAGAIGIPVFMPSRPEVFSGYSGDVFPFTEETPPRPAGILGETKFLAEALALQHESQKRGPVTILRSGLVVGETVAPHFLRSFIRKAKTREPIVTHAYENGSPKLDLIAAEDWLNAFWLLARSGLTGLFQVGGEDAISTRAIAELICSAAGPGCRTEELRLEGRAANIKLASDKLTRATGWQPTRHITDTLNRYIEAAFVAELRTESGTK